MVEREFFKNMMKKVIDDTEKNKIRSSEELIQTLIKELNDQRELNQNKRIIN
ncbi:MULTISPECIES: hypothetical protein [Ornithinibacillus]|uniref:Uncharacterized protein n=2 Tax=Ornithinibacillus TaxID=484508 RepID=A0A923RK39_9BACI|nr:MULTISPECIES: hypothetical protein [Ornithinibacillus]MBC5637913.1 hypothetical protein [Ornithinibacillus hominis]MBS3681723.1 hypothetical protein [Ornithinibacillus massiliensis]